MRRLPRPFVKSLEDLQVYVVTLNFALVNSVDGNERTEHTTILAVFVALCCALAADDKRMIESSPSGPAECSTNSFPSYTATGTMSSSVSEC